jgi:hypothetical protein
VVESTVQQHARVYTCRQQAMVNLGAGADLLDRYKVLRCEDLSVKTSVISPQEREQQNRSLPWFWTLDVQQVSDVGELMEDCMCFPAHTTLINMTFDAVSRVHWLRARAPKM